MDHTTKIRNVHGYMRKAPAQWKGAFKGAINDKTMVRTDPLVSAVGEEPMYVEMEFYVYIDDEGNQELVTGAFIINDGGYHRWLHTIAGPKTDFCPSYDEEMWGGRCESIRKDAERCFGILKKRWRILRLPFLLHSAKEIDPIFKVCCVLHNMLLQYDGLDTIGLLDSDYVDQDVECGIDGFDESLLSEEARNAEAMEDDPRLKFSLFEQLSMKPCNTPVSASTDMGLAGSQCPTPDNVIAEEDPTYNSKRAKLIKHFKHAWARKEVQWLKTAKECRPLCDRDPLGAPGPWHDL